jgi:hypothetical protein
MRLSSSLLGGLTIQGSPNVLVLLDEHGAGSREDHGIKLSLKLIYKEWHYWKQ